ncbi:MAG: response regulator [Candidatus Omnitrophica bacterium]|nr:response regulator [Candidatus Omnitrophota bacterium]
MFDALKNMFGGNPQKFKNNADKKILVVEDGETDRTVACRLLEKEGFQVKSAVNGQDGLKVMEHFRPDLIILDCDMPEMTGLEMCREIKDDPDTRDIPVLFLTGNSSPDNILDCYELDAENYLPKPLNAKLLLSQVDSILNEKNEA